MTDSDSSGWTIQGAWSWRRALLSSSLPSTTKLVLLALSCHVPEMGDAAWPAPKTLAEETSLNPETVKTHLRRGVRGGWLAKFERFAENGRQTTNGFRLTSPQGGGGHDPPSPSRPQGRGEPASPPGGGSTTPPHILKSSDEKLMGTGGENFSLEIEEPTNGAGPYPAPSALRRNGKGYVYPDAFEEVWSAYPDRRGGNPKKGAYRKWRELVVSGVSPADLLEAAEAYAKYVRAEKIEGRREVMMAKTFFGPDEPWSDDWEADAEAIEEGEEPEVGSVEWGRRERDRILRESSS